ncbi:MAG: ATP-binding protein [Bacteroidota bacterium]
MNNNSSIKHLAHDLNNIFTRILYSIDLLKRKIGGFDDVLTLLNSIESGTYLASEMIEDAIGSETLWTARRRININSIVTDVVSSFTPLEKDGDIHRSGKTLRKESFGPGEIPNGEAAIKSFEQSYLTDFFLRQKGKINFQTNLASNLKPVNGKYSDFYRVFLNLITNSIEAIDGKGNIFISTANLEAEEKIEIKIKDSGSGIEKTNLNHVFDEDFSTKDKNKTSGIGLSIVKKIIVEYNGIIKVSSEVGRGSEFTITLPAAAVSKTEVNAKGKTILIAEDEDILRELLAALFQSYDYTVLSSSDGKEVLDLLKVRIPDLLIIDRKMPAMDGITCIREIRNTHSNIPIILASGSPAETNETIEQITINKKINKPYNFEELLTLVRELIG